MSRLPAALEAAALLRLAEADGGFGTVLARGGEMGGLLLVLRSRGVLAGAWERQWSAAGYGWQRSGPEAEPALGEWLARRRARDPDEWQIELDTADSLRFVAERLGDD